MQGTERLSPPEEKVMAVVVQYECGNEQAGCDAVFSVVVNAATREPLRGVFGPCPVCGGVAVPGCATAPDEATARAWGRR